MTQTAESTMFADDRAEARIAECVADALDDREMLLKWWAAGLIMMDKFHETRVTLCDNGCVVDFEAIIRGFSPHAADVVERRAREVAWDREADNE